MLRCAHRTSGRTYCYSALGFQQGHHNRLKPSDATLLARDEGAVVATSYRRNVGVCLVNPGGLVFAARAEHTQAQELRTALQELDTKGAEGGIDNYENAMDAAVRELREETGITSARIVSTMDQWLAYDFPTSVQNRMTGSITRFKGQTQKWMLMYFYGDESEIDLEAGGEREFLEHAWMPLEEVALRVVPFKATVYAAVAREFGPLIRARQLSKRMGDSWWSR